MDELDNSTITIINLIIHVCLAVIFLNSMFYFLVSKAEDESLNKLMASLARGTVIANKDILIDNIEQKNLFLRTKNIYYNRYLYDDEVKKINNDWLFSVMIIITLAIIMIPITILVTLKYFCGYNIQLSHILFHNLLIVLFVISFEIYFIMKLAINYIPINPKTFTAELFHIIQESLVHEFKHLDEEKEIDDDNIIIEGPNI